ncbi:hypothetical protein [Streptomyces boncukensis]|uniref:Uncharacterized protein n=1 Tax=Streptomyces boncukensis TaxID=2711219 RepID=A0A6G4WYG9_9ACTN|nr:hypothetical protein [Streptomyces boncukensis]NGO69657.1 hypothetical protein [Streptomyces boncukensis]
MYDQTRAQQPPDHPPDRGERRGSGPDTLLPPDDRDRIALRLGRALNTFADTPHGALAEAEAALDEVTAQLANVLAERRRALRASWQEPLAESDELRLAMRQYREITQRLLRL